jgi:hypothetical protein
MFGMNFLNDAEREQLRAQHRREHDKRICDRIKAVLLRDKGWSIDAIAEALLLSKDAVVCTLKQNTGNVFEFLTKSFQSHLGARAPPSLLLR